MQIELSADWVEPRMDNEQDQFEAVAAAHLRKMDVDEPVEFAICFYEIADRSFCAGQAHIPVQPFLAVAGVRERFDGADPVNVAGKI
ncbi:hypothetical protein [Rhodopseudomonas sp. RCAM05734]|uniref:hypothetical protein n=1 Tax=Rhodopseudomonas sp. RCAM05734 TaxID=3457549 RepID=UPI004044A50D